MPIYEYACTSCGRSVEVIHGVHAAGPEVCEVCGGRMRKMLTTPSIVFKGSGWAKKDARDGARQRAGAAGRDESREGAAVAGDGDAASGKRDSKGESASGTSGAPSKDAGSSSKRTDGSAGAAKGGASD